MVCVHNRRVAGKRDGTMRAFTLARSHGERAVWALADQGINPLVQLCLTPLLLIKLGKSEFGLWALANAVLGMSQLVSCGAGVATTKHVSADLGAGERSQAVAAVRAALTIALLGGTAAALFAWQFAGVIVAHFFSRMGDPGHVAPIVALSVLAAAIQEIDNVYAGAMRGAERFDLGAKVEVPARICMGLALAMLSVLSASVHVLFAALVIMLTLKAALKAAQVAILLKSAKCCLPSLGTASLGRVFRFGGWQWLQLTGSALFTTTDQLLIGGLLGAASLARYSACLQIAQYVHMLPSVLIQVIFPRISALGARLDPRQGNAMLRAATSVSVGIACLIGLPIMALAYPLLTLWVGHDFAAANSLLLAVLVAVHIALAFSVGSYFVLLGSGRSARSAGIQLAAGTVQVISAFVVAPFGILAVACSRFLYPLLVSFLYRAARFKTHD
jgi:O-antigen/teichoic acid export membrane protein